MGLKRLARWMRRVRDKYFGSIDGFKSGLSDIEEVVVALHNVHPTRKTESALKTVRQLQDAITMIDLVVDDD